MFFVRFGPAVNYQWRLFIHVALHTLFPACLRVGTVSFGTWQCRSCLIYIIRSHQNVSDQLLATCSMPGGTGHWGDVCKNAGSAGCEKFIIVLQIRVHEGRQNHFLRATLIPTTAMEAVEHHENVATTVVAQMHEQRSSHLFFPTMTVASHSSSAGSRAAWYLQYHKNYWCFFWMLGSP